MSRMPKSVSPSRQTGSTKRVPAGRDVMLIAHRAGNVAGEVRSAVGAADVVELDLHLFRGRLEVRHAKVLWPFAARWERWQLVPRHSPRPTLEDIIRHVDADTHLWVDLKGFGSRLSAKVLEVVAQRPQTTVSSRSWWILPPPGRHRNVRVVHSVGSRLQLLALGTRTTRALEAVAIDQRLLDEVVMRKIRRVTSTVYVWGVRDVEQGLKLITAGADGLIVDGMETLVAIRSRLEDSIALENG